MQENITFNMTLAIAHQFRSELLDNFSDIEQWATKVAGKQIPNTACLGQKLAILAKHSDKAVKKLATDIEQALPLRNAIVHSKLDILTAQDGERLCLHLSASDIPNCAVLLKVTEITDYLAITKALVKRCAQLASRPEPVKNTVAPPVKKSASGTPTAKKAT